jgi:hypothetical protein
MTLTGYGAVVPGTKPLSIGDRLGSNYGGFPGLIDEVRVCDGVLSFERVAMQIVENARGVAAHGDRKTAGNRGDESPARDNEGREAHRELGGKEENFIVPDLGAGKGFHGEVHVNTSLKPAHYTLRARFETGDYATEQMTSCKSCRAWRRACPWSCGARAGARSRG